MPHPSAKKNTSPDDWKSKYSHIVNELTCKEREWVKAEELLRRTVRRLTIAATGIHPALDKRLADLRKTTGQHLEFDVLQQASDSMLETLRGLRNEPHQGQMTPTNVLMKLTDQLQSVDGIRQDALKLKSRLQNEPDQDELLEIISQFADLVSRPSAQPSQPSSNKNDTTDTESTAPISEKNLINTFIGNLDFPEISHTELKSIQVRSVEAGPEILKELAIELTTLLNNAGAQLEEQIQPDTNKTYKAADAILLLTEFLSFPESLSEKVSNIRAQLEKTLSEEEWPPLLKALADLIERARYQVEEQKYELENFLSELTNRVELMSTNVSGLSEVRAKGKAYSDVMGKNIVASVTDIHQSISSHDDIKQLRESVFRQLDGLREHVSKHQQQQQECHLQAEQFIGDLTNKLVSMEGETKLLRAQVKEQRTQATTDPLTKIFNRLAFDERMAIEFARWKRDKQPLSLVIWDADHFKHINDTFGHLAGDNILCLIADTLRKNSRESDLVARYGGEEFVVILPSANGEAALAIAETIRKQIECSNYNYEGKAVPVTLSAGIAEFEIGDEPDTVFARADSALYAAKRSGRNRCKLAESSTSTSDCIQRASG